MVGPAPLLVGRGERTASLVGLARVLGAQGLDHSGRWLGVRLEKGGEHLLRGSLGLGVDGQGKFLLQS